MGGDELSSEGDPTPATAPPTTATAAPGTEPTSVGPEATGIGPDATTSDATTSDATTSDATTSDATTSDATTSDATSETTTGTPLTLVIEGFGEFPTLCADDDCAARAACELVTGGACEWVEYDCVLAGVGSYVPPEGVEHPMDLSFGLYPLTADDFGNICACLGSEREAKQYFQDLGLGATHVWCGLGRWYVT